MQEPPWAFLPWQFQIRFALDPSCICKPRCPSPALLLGSDSQALILLASINCLQGVSCQEKARHSAACSRQQGLLSRAVGTWGEKHQTCWHGDRGADKVTRVCFYTVTFLSPEEENAVPRAFQVLYESVPNMQHCSYIVRRTKKI